MFALLFVLMDKSDEAQLVKFILRFKTVMFLTAGIAPAAFLGMSVHSCLSAVESGEPHLCIEAALRTQAWPSEAPTSSIVCWSLWSESPERR